MTRTELTKTQRYTIVSITLSASFLAVLTQFLFITAFPKIMAEFQINSTEVQWLTTTYMVTIAIMIPITAYFIDTFRTKTLMFSAMFLYFLGTLIGFLSPSFSLLLIGRVFQGLGSGIMIPLMQTILFLLFPRERRGFAMGLAGLVINVAPAIAPPISGVLIKYLDWRALFYISLPVAGLILILIFLFMDNITRQKETKIDPTSILLSSLGFGGLLIGFTNLQESGLSNMTTVISLSVGLFSLILFVFRQLRVPVPILQVRVLAVPIFALASTIAILSFSLLIAIETILPMFVQNAQEQSAFYGGMIVMPGALTLAGMSLLAGRLFDKYGGRIITIVGFSVLILSTISFAIVLSTETPFFVTALLFMVAMASAALINMPLMTAGINALPDDLIPHGTSVFNTIRQFGGTLGLTFIISFITRAEAGSATINPESYLTGVKTAFVVSSVLAFIGLVLSFFMNRGHKAP